MTDINPIKITIEKGQGITNALKKLVESQNLKISEGSISLFEWNETIKTLDKINENRKANNQESIFKNSSKLKHLVYTGQEITFTAEETKEIFNAMGVEISESKQAGETQTSQQAKKSQPSSETQASQQAKESQPSSETQASQQAKKSQQSQKRKPISDSVLNIVVRTSPLTTPLAINLSEGFFDSTMKTRISSPMKYYPDEWITISSNTDESKKYSERVSSDGKTHSLKWEKNGKPLKSLTVQKNSDGNISYTQQDFSQYKRNADGTVNWNKMPSALRQYNRENLGITTYLYQKPIPGNGAVIVGEGTLKGKNVAKFSEISKDGNTIIDSYREQTGVDSNGKPIFGKEYFREEKTFVSENKTNSGHFELTTTDMRKNKDKITA